MGRRLVGSRWKRLRGPAGDLFESLLQQKKSVAIFLFQIFKNISQLDTRVDKRWKMKDHHRLLSWKIYIRTNKIGNICFISFISCLKRIRFPGTDGRLDWHGTGGRSETPLTMQLEISPQNNPHKKTEEKSHFHKIFINIMICFWSFCCLKKNWKF